ncbi:MAG: molybdenum cofactor biosynthesis protein MoaE [Planctomycetes bacterium]|nr:molybdenum cofactor biosynthesis protein MoaE [Planctomycetota bacterium]
MSSFTFHLSASPIDPGAIAEDAHTPADGAVVTFVGVVRAEARGRRVTRLEYEAFGAMAETEMLQIFESMRAQFKITSARVVHRTGICQIGDPSIVIVVAAPHRGAAFDACRYCIDTLKQTVPIWKREMYEGGAEWVGDRS